MWLVVIPLIIVVGCMLFYNLSITLLNMLSQQMLSEAERYSNADYQLTTNEAPLISWRKKIRDLEAELKPLGFGRFLNYQNVNNVRLGYPTYNTCF